MALPAGGPPFWGILARFSGVSFAWPFILAHLSQPPRAWALVPLPVPPSLPLPRGKDNGGEEGVVEGFGWPDQAGGSHCVWGPECLHCKCLGC